MDPIKSHKHNGGIPSPGPIRDLLPPGAEGQKVTLDIAPAAVAKLFAAVVAFELFMKAWPVIIVVVLALMLAAAFNPLVRRLQARVSRTWAVAAVVVAVFFMIIGLLAILLPPIFIQGTKLVQDAPRYVDDLQHILAKHHIHINVSQQVQELSGKIGASAPHVLDFISQMMDGIAGALGMLVLTVYLLIEGPKSGNSLLRLLPREKRMGARNLASQLGAQVGGYIRGQMILSLVAALYTFIITTILGVPYSLALSALAGVADAIPMVGILMGLVPPALMALTISPAKAAIVVICYAVYHPVESHILAPNVFGNTMGLPLTVIVISFLVGLHVLGLIGAILALPVAAAIPSIVTFWHQWQEDRDTARTGY